MMKHGSHLVPRGVCRALHFNSIFLFFSQGILSIILVLFWVLFWHPFCRFGLHFLSIWVTFWNTVGWLGLLSIGFSSRCPAWTLLETLHDTSWISDDLLLDFHIEFSAYVIQFKNMCGQLFFDFASMPVLLRSAAQRAAALARSCLPKQHVHIVQYSYRITIYIFTCIYIYMYNFTINTMFKHAE